MILVSPDVEKLVPGLLYDALKGKYSGLYTDRAAPSSIGDRPVVVCHREGGLSLNSLLDQARLAIDVYASTEKVANLLALDARAVLEGLQGHRPFITVTTTGPSPITDSGKGPQRRFYADALIRKVTA